MDRLLTLSLTSICLFAWVATGCKFRTTETGPDAGGGGTTSTTSTSSADGGSAGAGGGEQPSPWSPTSSDTDEHLHGVWAGGSTTVIAVGDNGTVILSDDGGDSWSSATSSVTAGLKSVWSLGSEIYAVGDGGVIIHSTDEGETFATEDSGITGDLDSVWASGPSNVLASGDSGRVIRSTDGGTTWISVSNPAWGRVTGLWGIDATNIFAVGEALLLDSIDGGDSWSWKTASLSLQNDLYATAHDHVFIANASGTITRWDGSVWHKTITTPKREHYGVWGANADDVYVVGQAGTILHTSDGGEDWSYEDSGTGADLNDVFGAGDRVYAVGADGTITVRLPQR